MLVTSCVKHPGLIFGVIFLMSCHARPCHAIPMAGACPGGGAQGAWAPPLKIEKQKKKKKKKKGHQSKY